MSSDDRNSKAKKASRQETERPTEADGSAAQADEPADGSGSKSESASTEADRQKPKKKSLAGRIGGTVARALQPEETETGSLLGQVGTALIASAEEGEAGGADAKPKADAGDDIPMAQLDPGTDQVLSTIACSAVQGLRKAAAARSIPVKLFWTLMVFLSIGLFVRGTVILSMRLANVRLEKSFQLDKVPFVFPDLYFCPSNSYSGSFPYTLNESQVEVINQEVERLGQLFDLQFPTSGYDNSSKTRVRLIQQSLPVHLLSEYIMERTSQSLFFTPLITNVGTTGYEAIILPGSKVCYKTVLTEEERDLLTSRQNGEDLRLAVFTDPYLPNFKYSGHDIKPIINPILNESIPFRDWYPSGIIKMMGFGYTMLIVPRGAYPSMEHETKFKLATGKSYDITIHMEENRFSDELLGSNCSPDNENAAFVDHLTGRKVEYNYSYDACYLTELARSMHKVAGYVPQGLPVAWDLRGSPRWGNLTENLRINRSVQEYGMDKMKAYDLANPTTTCGRKQPCVRNRYTASFSFHNWPNMGGSYANAFQDSNPTDRPAISQMEKIALELDTGNFSFHDEAEFRHIISDSMLEVRIRTASPLAPRLLMTASYSATSFMSDLGGLMGLYLGCSVITLFELLEILYVRAELAVCIRLKRRRQPSVKLSATDSDTDGAVTKLEGIEEEEEGVNMEEGVAMESLA